MPKSLSLAVVDRLLTKAVKERQKHLESLARIDTLFATFGISPCAAEPALVEPVKAFVAAPAGKKSRRRKHFGQTGAEFVLGLLSGDKALPTAELNAAWIASGRKGNADNTLYLMTKAKQVKRTPRNDGPGSNYTAA